MLSKKPESLNQFYIDELVQACRYRYSESVFQGILSSHPTEILKEIESVISQQIVHFSNSIDEKLESKKCAERFRRLSILRKIRDTIKDKLTDFAE
jgi:hypothetical protein